MGGEHIYIYIHMKMHMSAYAPIFRQVCKGGSFPERSLQGDVGAQDTPLCPDPNYTIIPLHLRKVWGEQTENRRCARTTIPMAIQAMAVSIVTPYSDESHRHVSGGYVHRFVQA